MTTKHKALASILDNDLYKFTMQRAVLQHYPDTKVKYQFTNREKAIHLNAPAVEWLKEQIQDMKLLQLTSDERDYLNGMSFLDTGYVDYLSAFRYRPDEQVLLSFNESTSELELSITGVWHETILYEVPVLALISEAYFRFVDKDWDYEGQEAQAKQKGKDLLEHGCSFSEFGTRRRRDFKTHDLVLRSLAEVSKEYTEECPKSEKPKAVLTGTSNVHLARKYSLNAIGTVAHEFFMAVSALEGLKGANRKTLELWYKTYHGALGIALTDTFTTEVFLQDFQKDLAEKFSGVRHDSGSPERFIDIMVKHFKSLGIDPKTKTLVFSDSLNVARAIRLNELSKEAGAVASFGIGTSFTNDFCKKSNPDKKSKPMNIVIKLNECDGVPVYKLSDDHLKHSADAETIEKVKAQLGITK